MGIWGLLLCCILSTCLIVSSTSNFECAKPKSILRSSSRKRHSTETTKKVRFNSLTLEYGKGPGIYSPPYLFDEAEEREILGSVCVHSGAPAELETFKDTIDKVVKDLEASSRRLAKQSELIERRYGMIHGILSWFM